MVGMKVRIGMPGEHPYSSTFPIWIDIHHIAYLFPQEFNQDLLPLPDFWLYIFMYVFFLLPTLFLCSESNSGPKIQESSLYFNYLTQLKLDK